MLSRVPPAVISSEMIRQRPGKGGSGFFFAVAMLRCRSPLSFLNRPPQLSTTVGLTPQFLPSGTHEVPRFCQARRDRLRLVSKLHPQFGVALPHLLPGRL